MLYKLEVLCIFRVNRMREFFIRYCVLFCFLMYFLESKFECYIVVFKFLLYIKVLYGEFLFSVIFVLY